MSGIVLQNKNSIGYLGCNRKLLFKTESKVEVVTLQPTCGSREADNHEVNPIIRQKHSDILQEIAGKMLSEHKMLLYPTSASGIGLFHVRMVLLLFQRVLVPFNCRKEAVL